MGEVKYGMERHAYMIPWFGKVYDLRYDFHVEQNAKTKGK